MRWLIMRVSLRLLAQSAADSRTRASRWGIHAIPASTEKKRKSGARRGRHDGAHAHGHAERDGGGDRERGAHHHPEEALADVAGEAAVPDRVHGGAEHVAHAREHARVDVQDRHDPRPDDDKQREGGEEGDEPRERPTRCRSVTLTGVPRG